MTPAHFLLTRFRPSGAAHCDNSNSSNNNEAWRKEIYCKLSISGLLGEKERENTEPLPTVVEGVPKDLSSSLAASIVNEKRGASQFMMCNYQAVSQWDGWMDA